jgi:hypothetical protein
VVAWHSPRLSSETAANPLRLKLIRTLSQEVLIRHAADKITDDLDGAGMVPVLIGHIIQVLRENDRGLMAFLNIFDITLK